MLPLFETHCHLNHPQFEADGDAVLTRAREAGVERLVVIGYDLPSSRRAAEMARPEEGLFSTAGVHPHDADTWSAAAESELRELLARPGVVALGEIGLDFYRDLSPRDRQYDAFRAQLDLAAELGLPIVVHTRDSVTEALAVLEPYARAGLRAVMHCWSGTVEEARRARALGFLLGIGGVLTWGKKAESLVDVVCDSPLESLVLETDCPYLTPAPHRGKRNEPAFLSLVAAKLAEVKSLAPDEVARRTRENAARLFGDRLL
jgi:TatD DNase family protein